MMILISGQPGNGKTLRAMALMEEEYLRNQEGVKAGKETPRRFFTNIAGATPQDNPSAFEWVEALPDHNDWRELPDGSYVVYDEAHADGVTQGLERYGLLFPGTGKPGEASDPRIKAMSTHRHRGFDLVFVTQWPSKVHHTLRQLVGKHIHMNRALGLQRAGTLSWTRVQPDPYDEREREKAEEEIWVYPKTLYGRYRSATLHTATYKFKMPKKAWQALSMAGMILLVGWLLWLFVFKPPQSEAAELPEGEARGIALAPPGAGGPASRNAQDKRVTYSNAGEYLEMMRPRIEAMPWTAPAFDGQEVVSKPRVFCASAGAGLNAAGHHVEASCRCLTEQGTRYAMRHEQCMALAEIGEPYNPFRAPEESQAARAGVQGVTPAAMDANASASSSARVIEGEQISGYGDIGVGNTEAAPR